MKLVWTDQGHRGAWKLIPEPCFSNIVNIWSKWTASQVNICCAFGFLCVLFIFFNLRCFFRFLESLFKCCLFFPSFYIKLSWYLTINLKLEKEVYIFLPRWTFVVLVFSGHPLCHWSVCKYTETWIFTFRFTVFVGVGVYSLVWFGCMLLLCFKP